MLELVLRIKCQDNWVADITKKHDIPIRFLGCKPFGENGGRSLIEIEDSDDTEALLRDMANHPEICHLDVFPSKNGRILGRVSTERCYACKLLTGSDCFLTSAVTIPGGWTEWTLVSPAEGAVSQLISNMKTAGFDVDILRKTVLEKDSVVTDLQMDVLTLAFEEGYYDQPRRTSVRKLSKKLGVSASTVSEILKRGEKKIVQRFLHAGK